MTKVEHTSATSLLLGVPSSMEEIAERYQRARGDIAAHVYAEPSICRAVTQLCQKHQRDDSQDADATMTFTLKGQLHNYENIGSFDLGPNRFQVIIRLGKLTELVSVTADDVVEYIQRLNTFANIINLASDMVNDKNEALRWYATQKLPAFGNMTAKKLVHIGEGPLVEQYLHATVNGNFDYS